MDADKLPWRLVRREDGTVMLLWNDSALGEDRNLGPFEGVAEYLTDFLAGENFDPNLADSLAAEDYGERS